LFFLRRGQKHRPVSGRKVTITRLLAATWNEVAALTASGAADPVRHFGRQVKKARLARGWTVREAGRQLGYDDAQVSRVENGNRPPTEGFAKACDRVWPERNGWFLERYSKPHVIEKKKSARAASNASW
jgi:ribosome-binding protein aMBF1 (putative translation factor)